MSPSSYAERSGTRRERYFEVFRDYRNQIGVSYVQVIMDWMAEGNCNNHPPAVFFPSDGVGVEVAKKICGTCPVNEACLEYALGQRIDHGVWGGTSERQRRRILKARRELADASID